MKKDKEIEMWAEMSKRLNDNNFFESEDEGFEWGSIIGTFVVDSKHINEMGSIGKIDYPHQFVVYVHPDEGMIPHFHVFDKEGKNKKRPSDPGIHTCIEIRSNRYFKHNGYMDNLDKDTRIALNDFMKVIRNTPTYRSDLGQTNFKHTINQWDDNNAKDESPDWVDPDMQQPNYTTLIDNL